MVATPSFPDAISTPPHQPRTYRERFYQAFQHHYPNLHAIYHLVSIVCIWSGCWYFADTWATGHDVWAAAVVPPLIVPARHLILAAVGVLLLLNANGSLNSLITMKDEPPLPLDDALPWHIQILTRWKHLYRDQMALYTLLGIILCWCGTWGLLWDIPLWPWLRSLITIGLGLGMLYLDNLSLDQLQ